MSLGLAFWILMLIWLALGVYTNRASLAAAGLNLGLLFILLVLLGWAEFGAPIKA